MTNYSVKGIFQIIVVIFCCAFVVTSCNTPIVNTKSVNYPQAEVVFQVTLPSALSEGKGLYLEILDEVTGLYFNPARFEMARSSDTLFFVKVPLTIGAEICYRYARVSDSIDIEYNSKIEQVTSRKLIVSGPDIIQDSIAGWFNEPYQGSPGRIRGQILDQANQAPIPNLIISAAGLMTTTSSDGSFILEKIPAGTQNVTIFSKDGAYIPFQQYAKVDSDATTPIFISLIKRELVTVTFSVKTPDDFEMILPLRIAGSLASLGNPFTQLNAGAPNSSSSLPVMDKTGKGKYRVSMQLPSGAYFHYKYTLGDGFWNSEITNEGQFIVREWIVPTKDTTIQDKIESFKSPNIGEVAITVSVPELTPGSDNVFLQLNPYDWMEPLPMVKTDLNKWEYILYSPTHLVSSTTFRFCRNGDCKSGLSAAIENNAFQPGIDPIKLTPEVTEWTNLSALQNQSFIENDGLALQPQPGAITGVEVSPNYPSTWRNSIENGLIDIKSIGANWVILTPRWSITSINPPMIEPFGSQNVDWVEVQWLVNHVKLQGLQPVLFPQVDYSYFPNFWNESNRDGGWWQSYYDRYQRFIMNYADLAELLNIDSLVIGDPGVTQFMQLEPNSNQRWLQLISDIKARFSGEIIGVVSIPSEEGFPAWVSGVDKVYVLFAPNLSTSNNLIEVYGEQLDALVYPVFEAYGKPVILGISNPSNTSSLDGCIDGNGSCFYQNDSSLPVDLIVQAKIYNAAAVTSFSRPWIEGFVSRGYYPYIKTQDNGSSVNGKPAYDVLWFWYHLIQNITP